MDKCYVCFEKIIVTITWDTFLFEEKKQVICDLCSNKLVKLSGPLCEKCHRHSELAICQDCSRWENTTEWKGVLEKNVSLFSYNDFLKDIIARFKYRGDYALAEIFAEDLREKINLISFNLVTTIPLSSERLYERGFNQAEAISLSAGIKPLNLLSRIHSEKQSKKTRSERLHMDEIFSFDSKVDIKGKSILIIDDIYTTGATLRHAAKILKRGGATQVSSITIAR
ncbi:ComF family protein [Peribacillus alkalitolerans]|uniref:ComF family protein n=1 Tax=Peribacillus alkalitolerans TaxID=1550385 RepID=UPI0013D37533|nr:ComF family protein [Peribacillus alkalitolerans]